MTALPSDQVFWVVQNGIKMSGMPNFGGSRTALSADEGR